MDQVCQTTEDSLRPGTQYSCLEANPSLIKTLEENVLCNSSHLNCSVVNGAIAYEHETVDCEVSPDNQVSSLQSSEGSNTVSVKAVGLRDCLSGQPYQLVCDIEGAEADILAHDEASLSNCQLAIIELHKTRCDQTDITVDELADGFRRTGMKQIDNYGDVFVFGRQHQ